MINKYKVSGKRLDALELHTEDYNGAEKVIWAPGTYSWMIGKSWNECKVYLDRHNLTIQQTTQGAANVLPSSQLGDKGDTGRR